MEINENTEALVADCKAISEEIYKRFQNPERVKALLCERISTLFVQSNLSIKGEKFSVAQIKNIQKEGFFPDDFDENIGNQILSINDCFEKLFHLVQKPTITEEHLVNLHKLLMARSEEKDGGKFYGKQPEETQKKLYEFLDWFNSNCNNSEIESTEFVATVYQKYIYMHPFKGGNGIMARLMINLACLKRSLCLLVIPSDEKENYDKLIAGCKTSVTEEFINFIRNCIIYSSKYVKASQKEVYSEHKNRHLRGIDHTDLVLKTIRENPGVKTMEIKQFTKNISFIKLQHIIKALRDQGLVEFRGALRNGGYYSIDVPEESNNTKNEEIDELDN